MFLPDLLPLAVLLGAGLGVTSVGAEDSGDHPLCLFLGGPEFAMEPWKAAQLVSGQYD